MIAQVPVVAEKVDQRQSVQTVAVLEGVGGMRGSFGTPEASASGMGEVDRKGWCQDCQTVG